MDRERLQKIRNFQSTDWYPALFVRPLSILVMLVIADWKFLTPNRLTTIANLGKVGAACIIAFCPLDLANAVAGVVLLHVGIIFDHLDGTMARYRGTFTKLGSFYDKVSDLVTWFIVMMAIGWAAYGMTGEPHVIMLAAAAAFSLDAMGYMKWLSVAESERLRWLEARAEPETTIARHTAPIRVAPPPARSRAEWLRWLVNRSWQFVRFEEMDLFFWLSLGLLLGQLEWTLWLLAVTQTVIMVWMIVRRWREIMRVDQRMRELEGG